MLADGNYTQIARKKLATLIRQDDFQAIEKINSESFHVMLSFTDGKTCTVDSWGKVLWQTIDNERLANNVKEMIHDH